MKNFIFINLTIDYVEFDLLFEENIDIFLLIFTIDDDENFNLIFVDVLD